MYPENSSRQKNMSGASAIKATTRNATAKTKSTEGKAGTTKCCTVLPILARSLSLGTCGGAHQGNWLTMDGFHKIPGNQPPR